MPFWRSGSSSLGLTGRHRSGDRAGRDKAIAGVTGPSPPRHELCLAYATPNLRRGVTPVTTALTILPFREGETVPWEQNPWHGRAVPFPGS